MAKQIIYQVLTRLWGDGKMSSWDAPAFEYLKSLSVDWVWYTGVPRHATGQPFVKGDPGSPYAISDWYDVNPYLASDPERRVDEFKDLVLRTHAAGLKLMTDFIPNHVARDYEGAIVRHDWCDGDWTDTFKNDFSDPATVPACIDILCFWAEMGVDGFRCDMVELVPAEAMRDIISGVRARFPETFFVAEVYGRENYGKYIREVGFDLLYDKSGAYDILRSIVSGFGDARELTRNWQGLQDLQGSMLNFLENHDEQRLASPYFAGSPSRGYAALAFAALFNDASLMLYFGQEAGECASEGHEGRTSIFEWKHPATAGALGDFAATGRGLSRSSRSVLARYRGLLKLAARPVFRSGSNWDLCYCQPAAFDSSRHFAFIRYDSSEAWAVFCNFSDSPVSLSLSIPSEPLGRAVSVPVSAEPWDFCAVRISNRI